MSNSSSDTDEFFDAEDYTVRNDQNDVPKQTSKSEKEILDEKKKNLSFKISNPAKLNSEHNGRRKFNEIRQHMQIDEDESQAVSPTESQASSADGVFLAPSHKPSHPFRVIEPDGASVQSILSLGKVGRLLGSVPSDHYIGKDNTLRPSDCTKLLSEPSTPISSEDKFIVPTDNFSTFHEPDVIASTKTSTNGTCNIENDRPVAPPRRRRRKKSETVITESIGATTTIDNPNQQTNAAQSEESNTSCLTSPASTIESLTRELEHSLDLHSATKGQYVVNHQDEEKPGLSVIKEITDEVKEKSKTLTSHSNTYPMAGTSGITSIRSHNRVTSRERRRSAGDEQELRDQQLNMFLKTHTDSGKKLTDIEILEQITVLNLDTGERVPLSIAEDKLPQCINPLSLHIMRLTSEYVSTPNLDSHSYRSSFIKKPKESDEESIGSKSNETVATGRDDPVDESAIRRRTARIKRFLGTTVKKTVNKAKTIAHEVSHVRHKEDVMEIVDLVERPQPAADAANPPQVNEAFKLRSSNSHKGPYEFDSVQHVQEFCNEHVGPVWCMKFSMCGRLLATAGQDRVLRIWVLRDAYKDFHEMRKKYDAEKVSPTPSTESLVSQLSVDDQSFAADPDDRGPFISRPFCTYTGHRSDLLDIAWSKNYFVLSSSMDKTVRLWHISRRECLCCFQHIDFVTAICFHPRDDRYFLSGSLDGKLRLWNIPDKKVAVWNEVEGQTKLITAANFCQNGKFAVVGSYDGRCIFYTTDQLRYHTQIHVRSTRGRNSTGRKISGIEPMPGEDKILVTSNDSRIRLYDLRDLNLSCKYKGYVNISSQIKASFSHDGKYIVCGSENQCIYVWKTHHDYSKFTSVRRDRNDYWEGIKAHNAVVTCAIFAPNPEVVFRQMKTDENNQSQDGYVLVSADFNGCIRVFVNRMKPKHSSLPASAMA
ncbi:WD repeat-containing protein 44 [Adelges cooleyi]|uniref:WD repeat-containing protein 44 n=1 Tax=Adelges cooleyi TaxID=133065 RepID=UPI00217F3F44|nr:WD repeat-containing protein 44 [Adelges cooleyi]XP_050437519.1 WD repeat-containing protein 44 [Adelges cooleyi]XP_050437520.1 WD repeat-containing protein 44 [Adelges cooleyi]